MTVRQGSQGSAATVVPAVAAGSRSRLPALAAGVARRVRDGAASVRWYVRQVMGDDAYATYAAHQRAVHPGGVVMTEREFWRMRHAEQDANPGSRCC
ncbi:MULTISPECIES: YbdD/YjiX family protein [Cellulosimicrobium]|nr:YbdD/YjiX family protein [Cellulosimicrobium cellulans]